MNVRTLILAAVLIAISQGTAAACSLSTLKGAYGALATATAEVDGFLGDGYLVSRFIFDGAGKVQIKNGTATAIGQSATFKGNGRYKLSSNCVGSLSFSMPFLGDNWRGRLNFVVTGTPSDHRILSTYTATDGSLESGQLILEKIGL